MLLNDGGCFDKIAIDESNYIGLVAVKAPLNVYYENFKNLIPSFLSVFLRAVCGGGGVCTPGY